MIRSMTGFGQSGRSSGGYRLLVELKSVNHRYSEITVRIPREWLSLEDGVKREIQHAVKRGKVEAFVSIEKEAGGSKSVEIDWTIAEGYRQAAEQLRERFGISDTLTLKDMMTLPGLILFREAEQEAEPLTEPLLEIVREAASIMLRMRETEGDHISRYMTERLEQLDYHRREMVSAAGQAVEEFRSKLHERLTELLGDAALRQDDPRLITEVAVMADRSDVGEELSRLSSHIDQCRKLLSADEPVGRRLDFLIQEMNREVNTIGSKSNRLELADRVIEMKAELEKMREQAQNIE
ncbi:YicC family protein [Paenibacillus hemerocallicola]|uniref:YicC family protein n=1 Tax=Paenibacillus hemerocallicola TaxID=1172614 RepID=A0A5C4TF64_9BACL|nr:YicC/YloC family endoribonuclease [Paenibacillus hemerocallicola]TNJ67207.1 YicC family protein [Paenibacillus hemerocallicola]